MLARFAKFGFFGIVVFFVFLFFVLPLLAFNLPSPDKIVRNEGFSTKILDRNGKPLYDIYEDKRRTPVEIDEVPLYLRQATIAIEDKNFYKHQGFDPFGMVRGFLRIFTRGRAAGGSTLTQQLVKNVLLSNDRTLIRKIKEFVIAVQIEKRYTKDQILQMYLNEAPYGGTAWGVEAASEAYFGKKVTELNLVESAILAGLPQSPTRYSPYSSTPKAYVARTKDVLRRMREDEYINKSQEEESLAELEKIVFQPRGSDFKAPHFVQYIQKVLEDRYGASAVDAGGLTVTTTLDLDLQEKAQSIVAEEIAKVEGQHITNGAVVAVNPDTGEILAMVGSKNFNADDYDGQVNVTTALRQPGSSFKPFTYVTAIKKGFTASTLLMDVPTTFPGGAGQPDYEPVNYDGKYRGPVQLRYALGNSLNIPAVKMLALTGIKDVLKTATDLGITTLPPTQETLNRVGLSLTLGGGEVRLLDMAVAYSPFANKGYRVEPVGVLKVTDFGGKILEERKLEKGKRVLTEEQAFLVADILSDNNARKEVFGTGSLLNVPGKKILVKTGTTNDKRDNWTIGGNQNVMVGVWVGNNDNSPMRNVASGVSGASPIWRKVLLEALSGKTAKDFEMPSGIVTASVDSVSGYASHDGFLSRSEYFIKGTEPGEDPVHTYLKICKSEGKLATPGDIAGGNYDNKEFFVFKEEDPTSGGGENRWQKGILSWLSTQPDPRYHPPGEYCGTVNPLSVRFINPTDGDSYLSDNIKIKIGAESTADITQVELLIDGTLVKAFSGLPYEFQGNSAYFPSGMHTLKAIARDSQGRQAENTISIGINVPWSSPSPAP